MKYNDDTIKRSCRLGYCLRHDQSYEYEVEGWRSVDNLIEKEGFTVDELTFLVNNDVKNRYEFNADRTKIRALYGHSVPVELGLPCSPPPDVLYHGTYKEVDIGILEGLSSKARRYVHLSSSIDSAEETGARHGFPVLIQIAAKKMYEEEGYEFFNPTGNVWLVREVPSRFFIRFTTPLLPCSFQSENWVESKTMKIVCDSDEAIARLKKDNMISSMCGFEHLSNTPFTLHTLGEWLDRQIYIIAVTDSKSLNHELLDKITKFQEYTRGIILISPLSVHELPGICANDVEDIHRILYSICLLIQGGMPMHIDFNDIHSALLQNRGEIRFLQGIVNTGSDMIDLWNDLIDLIKKNQVGSCIIHLSLPEDCNSQKDSIWDEFCHGQHLMHDKIPHVDCHYGCSYNKDIDGICLSVFMR